MNRTIYQTTRLTFSFVLCCSLSGFAQFMQDSAPDGNSSLIGGTTVSVDIQKTTLQLDYTGKFGKRDSPADARYWNWGASLSGGNTNRVAQLLQNGLFTPSARISGFVFHGWDVGRNKTNDLKAQIEAASKDVTDFKSRQQSWFDTNLRDDLFTEIGSKLPDSDPTKHATMQAIYTDNIAKGMAFVVRGYRKAQVAAGPALQTVFADIIELMEDKMKAFNNQSALLDLQEKEKAATQRYIDFQRLNPVRRFLVYGRVGMSATGFSYFPSINTADIAGSFKDSLFTSPYIELGGNFYTRGYLIMGLNVGYGRVNTLTSPVTYKYQAVTNGDDGQQITIEEEIQAYQGTPTQYGQFRVKADLIGLIPAGDRGTLALSPYARFSTTQTPQNRWRYGVAAYYFNRKGGFMGGLYAERTSLVTQVSPNTYTVVSRGITLGLRASFLIDTVFNTEKPR